MIPQTSGSLSVYQNPNFPVRMQSIGSPCLNQNAKRRGHVSVSLEGARKNIRRIHEKKHRPMDDWVGLGNCTRERDMISEPKIKTLQGDCSGGRFPQMPVGGKWEIE